MVEMQSFYIRVFGLFPLLMPHPLDHCISKPHWNWHPAVSIWKLHEWVMRPSCGLTEWGFMRGLLMRAYAVVVIIMGASIYNNNKYCLVNNYLVSQQTI